MSSSHVPRHHRRGDGPHLFCRHRPLLRSGLEVESGISPKQHQSNFKLEVVEVI